MAVPSPLAPSTSRTAHLHITYHLLTQMILQQTSAKTEICVQLKLCAHITHVIIIMV